MAANAGAPDRGERSPCIDRQRAGDPSGALRAEAPLGRDRTPDIAPETLYLTRIAMLEARVATLEATVEEKERELQRVVDRYEHLLDARRGEVTDTEEPGRLLGSVRSVLR